MKKGDLFFPCYKAASEDYAPEGNILVMGEILQRVQVPETGSERIPAAFSRVSRKGTSHTNGGERVFFPNRNLMLWQ